MRAIFKIPHLPPPKLSDFTTEVTWSSTFTEFLEMTLVKNPSDRKDAVELLKLPCFKECENASNLKDLIEEHIETVTEFRKAQLGERLLIEEEMDEHERNTGWKTMKTEESMSVFREPSEIDGYGTNIYGTTVYGDKINGLGTTIFEEEKMGYGTTLFEDKMKMKGMIRPSMKILTHARHFMGEIPRRLFGVLLSNKLKALTKITINLRILCLLLTTLHEVIHCLCYDQNYLQLHLFSN